MTNYYSVIVNLKTNKLIPFVSSKQAIKWKRFKNWKTGIENK